MKRLLNLFLTTAIILGLATTANAFTLQYYSDESPGGLGQVLGSDGRLNVSSRSDTRAFYISRDDEEVYVLRIEDDDAVLADIVVYLQNTSPTKDLYILDIHVSSENAATFKIAFGDATAATGTAVDPVNLNRGSPNDSADNSFGNGAVGGVTASTFFSSLRVGAGESEEWGFERALILGQNDNIVIEYDTGSTGDIEIDIFFFQE